MSMNEDKEYFIELTWGKIRPAIVVPKVDEIVRLYDNGTVTDRDGTPVANVRGWEDSDLGKLKDLASKIDARIWEESDDADLDPIEVITGLDRAKKALDNLPTVEPRAPKPEPKPEPKAEPVQVPVAESQAKPEIQAQKSAPEPQARTRRARAGGYRLGTNGEWIQDK